MSSTALAATNSTFRSPGGHIKGKFRVNMGNMELTDRSLIFYARPFWTLMFGLLGALLFAGFKGKAHEIDLRTVATFGRGRFGINKRVLDLTTTDGTTHRFVVDKFDELIPCLHSTMAQLGLRVTQCGDETWQVQSA